MKGTCNKDWDVDHSFLVPLKGGIGGIVHPPLLAGKIPQKTPLIVLAFWGVICYLPSFTGTWNNHWILVKSNCRNQWKLLAIQLVTNLWTGKFGFFSITCCHGNFTTFTRKITLPETNSEFAPENAWLEYDRFLLGWPIFRGDVSFREGRP